MLFSIIVPIYRVEKFVRLCIESILQQNYSDFELLLVDDGSDDNCPTICDEYANNFENVKVIHKKNGGLVSARQEGLRRAKGRYILNVDGDDVLLPSILKSLSNIIEEFEPDMITMDSVHINESGILGNTYPDNAGRGLYIDDDLDVIKKKVLFDYSSSDFNNDGSLKYTIWSKVIKRDLLKKIQYDVPIILTKGEDVAVTIPTVMICSSIYVSHIVGYGYRQVDGSMTRTFNENELDKYTLLHLHLSKEEYSIPSKNIAGYFTNLLKNQIVSASKYYHSFPKFAMYCNKNVSDELRNDAKIMYEESKSIKIKIISYLLLNKQWFVLWLMCKTI
jgi:glycosyltransferase involved in cell wall biosynthesis